MSLHLMPGPGDEITWPPCVGHPGDPRTEDDGWLNEIDALEVAQDEADRDGYQLAFWLANRAITEHTGPVDLAAVRERMSQGEECTASELLALVFNESSRAVYLLREQFRAHADTREWVKGRASEILAAQEEQDDDEGAHYDRLAAIYAGAM